MRKKVFLLLSIGMMLFIWGNSMTPGEISGQTSGGVTDVLVRFLGLFGLAPEGETVEFWVRKTAHFTEFALLGIFAGQTLCRFTSRRWSNLVSVLFWVLSTAVADEFIQLFVPGRSSQVRDVLIDFCGGLIGLVCLYGGQTLREKLRKKGKKQPWD